MNKKLLLALFFMGAVGINLTYAEKTTACYQVVPLPDQIILSEGSGFTLDSKTRITYPNRNDKMERNAEFLSEYIEGLSGIELRTTSGNRRRNSINLELGLSSDNPEAYKIKVEEQRVTVTGASEKGVFYGIQTLRKSIPVKNSTQIVFPLVEINDEPRFLYRGMMLDVARHIFSVEEVKTFIDMLALHNINTFHWHLTEDQGWRIEIKQYPKLTEIGSQRSETVIGRNTGEYDGEPYGGYFTQEEVLDIIDYARKRYINVIPEIDMPGHMLAALASYPELGCTGGPYEVWTKWGISEDVLCVGDDNTLEFVKNVLNEVMDLFPSEFIHIGGDEAPKTRWEECSVCQAKIEELGLISDDEHTAEERLQSYFISYAEEVINARGRRMIGWDEILEGGLAPNATVMSWRGMDGGIEAARLGHDVVMTPNSHVYFDHYQSTDVENDPLAIGGYSPVERVYELEPVPPVLTEEEGKHILGAQANLWTEYVPTFEHAQFMVLPRMAALSEVQWMQPENKNYEEFLKRVQPLIRIYDNQGYNYAKHIFDVKAEFTPNSQNGTIDVKLESLTDDPIYYTLDGTVPDKNSNVYSDIIQIDENVTLKALTYFNGEQSRLFSEEITFNKATTKPITALQPVNEQYKYEGITTLVDGLRGNANYRTGRWIAFRGNDLEAVIDLKENKSISEAIITTNVVKADWIFDLTSFVVKVSDDGETFREVASKEYPVLQSDDEDGVKEHSLSFESVETRYVKIIAGSTQSMPEWHGGEGNPAFLFVDEIIIN
ncbi:glycoside hydrolase family 20 protein [Marinilabiliaceae bacterium ANBcel2]|nr:glycoside hydrolase family 20 protein [Marinilabiliaceae bacterium ANBcel2]